MPRPRPRFANSGDGRWPFCWRNCFMTQTAALERSRKNCSVCRMVPPDIEVYRGDMELRARPAKQLAETILADPDCATAAFDQLLSGLPQHRQAHPGAGELPASRAPARRSAPRHQLHALVLAEICKEVRYPYPSPICSSLSSQYYWTVADMDLIFVPSLEPERLLGLADLYHELGHIILFREERRLVIPGVAIVDRHFDRLIHDRRRAGWPAASLREVQQFRHLWRMSWFLEFCADLIATYLVGPAFGWCNIRTSTNIGGELFRGNDSHPADDGRSAAMGSCLIESGKRVSRRDSEPLAGVSSFLRRIAAAANTTPHTPHNCFRNYAI